MSFDPREFLSLVERITGTWDDEASMRTAVGRAYYACFLAARERLAIRTHTGRVHHEVIGALRRRDRPAADQLHKLESLRTAADYELTQSSPQADWQSHWQQARQYARYILNKLR